MTETQRHGARRPPLAWRLACASGLAAAFFVLDRITKAIVRATIMVDGPVPFIPGVLRLQFVANTGAAFSLGEGHGLVFVAFAVLVVAASIVYLWRAPSTAKLEVVGLGMVCGGAIGNAIDRLAYGFVVDFFATEFIDFPVFNVADIGITVGVVLAFLGYLFFSPAAREVNATAELNARDDVRAARKARERGERSRRWREKNDR